MKPILCYIAHRYQAHAYKGRAILFCRRCGETVELEDPDEKEGKE